MSVSAEEKWKTELVIFTGNTVLKKLQTRTNIFRSVFSAQWKIIHQSPCDIFCDGAGLLPSHVLCNSWGIKKPKPKHTHPHPAPKNPPKNNQTKNHQNPIYMRFCINLSLKQRYFCISFLLCIRNSPDNFKHASVYERPRAIHHGSQHQLKLQCW